MLGGVGRVDKATPWMREVLSAHLISRSSSGFSQKYDLPEPRQPRQFV